ncbi:trace amine-associated receptor 13c-like [Montipora capricornis]|uniref:trace amine-associated receptor 13c-like n=1 Tax=Montipora capricornis TaxID=246305 RepID=UPI0035F1EFAD
MVNFTASSSNLTNTGKETNSTMQDKTQDTVSVAFLSINIIINIITCPFTVGLNAMVIIAIKRRPRLQSNANVLLACLAVTDVLTGLTSQPSSVIWNVSLLVGAADIVAVFRDLQAFFFALLAYSSSLHLMIVVCERLVAIKFPYRYPYILTKRNIKLAILFCWTYSALCRIGVYAMDKTSLLYFIFLSHILNVCVVFVTSSYVVLYFETSRHQKMIKAQQLSQEDVERFLKDCKALKTTVLVVCAVGLCLLPGNMYFVARYFDFIENRVHLVSEITWTSMMINSLLNPLIYCWRQRELRNFIFKPFSNTVNPIG